MTVDLKELADQIGLLAVELKRVNKLAGERIGVVGGILELFLRFLQGVECELVTGLTEASCNSNVGFAEAPASERASPAQSAQSEDIEATEEACRSPKAAMIAAE
jgi:hypothetical protein